MSRGGLANAFAWSDRLRGGKPGDVNAWETAINNTLPQIVHRIKDLRVLHDEAIDVIKEHDSENSLIYCDPPYLKSTRTSTKTYGREEMSEDDHRELGEVLNACKGTVIISGYPSDVYDEIFKGWKVIEKGIVNHSSQQKIKQIKTECIWVNKNEN